MKKAARTPWRPRHLLKMFPNVFFHSVQKAIHKAFSFLEKQISDFVDFMHKKNGETLVCVCTCVSLCVSEVGGMLSGVKHQAWRELRLTRIVLISAFPSLKL